MSQDSYSHIGKSFPSEEPTFTADAWIAFKLQYEMLPGDGTPTISRLRCDDPNVMNCFTTRRFDDRHAYHDSIAESDQDEYNTFGQPGRSRKGDSLRVWTNPFFSPSGSYDTGINPGAWEGHKFRYPGTTAKFETTLGIDGKWKKDVPTEGWVRLHGQISVSCTFIRMPSTQKSMGVYADVNQVWVTEEALDGTDPTNGTEIADGIESAGGTNVPSIIVTECKSAVKGSGIRRCEEGRLQVPRQRDE